MTDENHLLARMTLTVDGTNVEAVIADLLACAADYSGWLITGDITILRNFDPAGTVYSADVELTKWITAP